MKIEVDKNSVLADGVKYNIPLEVVAALQDQAKVKLCESLKDSQVIKDFNVIDGNPSAIGWPVDTQ